MIIQGNITKDSGIYCIENVINHKRYIGRGTKLIERKRHYLSYLPRNLLKQRYLQNAYNKYGKYCFVFYPIGYYDRSQLMKMEQYWMDFYDTLNRKHGYNIRMAEEYLPLTEEHKRHIGEANTGKVRSPEVRLRDRLVKLGTKHTQAWKEKARKIMLGNNYALGKKHTAEQNSEKSKRQLGKSIKSKAVKQFDINGNLIRIFKSAKEAAGDVNKTNIYSGRVCISGAIKGIKNKTAYGFKWAYVMDGK